MKRWLIPLLLLSACCLSAQPDMKRQLADLIVQDLLSMWSEADIPGKYSFLVWPAYNEISKESNWPRLELIRDISTVGDLVEVWPSREALAAAVYRNLPERALKEYVDMIQTASR
jgi:hypothetical protein